MSDESGTNIKAKSPSTPDKESSIYSAGQPDFESYIIQGLSAESASNGVSTTSQDTETYETPYGTTLNLTRPMNSSARSTETSKASAQPALEPEQLSPSLPSITDVITASTNATATGMTRETSTISPNATSLPTTILSNSSLATNETNRLLTPTYTVLANGTGKCSFSEFILRRT